MHHRRREHRDPRMPVLGVIPLQQLSRERLRVLEAAQARRKARRVLDRFELALRVRIVIGDMGARMRLGHPQIYEQLGHALAGHRRAPVGMDCELFAPHLMGEAGRKDQFPRKFRALALGHYPADDKAAEDVKKDVQAVIAVFDRPFELGNVPAPDLVGSGGQEFGLLILRMSRLRASLFYHLLGVQNAVHRGRRAEIDLLVEQRGYDLAGRSVHEAVLEEGL